MPGFLPGEPVPGSMGGGRTGPDYPAGGYPQDFPIPPELMQLLLEQLKRRGEGTPEGGTVPPWMAPTLGGPEKGLPDVGMGPPRLGTGAPRPQLEVDPTQPAVDPSIMTLPAGSGRRFWY